MYRFFRSIDSGSVRGFPKVVQEAESKNLVCAKNLKIDKSIHSAYVKAIRSAQHFIYIENQYFLGSSYFWPSYKNAGAYFIDFWKIFGLFLDISFYY
ncbi:putative phospholipase D [Dioscorea sansibarensis]